MNRCIAHPHRRRGVLLLVVLSMLTLFMLLGTAYLVVSTRSRFTARAFNRLVMLSDEARIPRDAYLDRTLMHVVRGGTSAGIPALSGTGALSFESLLEDKYGRNATLTGTAPQVSGSSTASPGPVLTLTNVTLTSATSGTTPAPSFPTAAELPGRVLTLCPDDGVPTSHRILSARATGAAFTLVVDTPTSVKPFCLPSGTTCRVVVNGREFDGQGTTNEAWDGFDVNGMNPFLARIEPAASSVSTGSSMRMSYVTTGTDRWDCDNDGRPDSHFLDFGFPSIPTSSGTIEFHAAVLVVDLDSRFNVNAHGSLVTTGSSGTAGIYGSNHPGWPKNAFLASTGTSLDAVPIGSGYGPAEVNPTWLFRVASGTTAAASPPNQETGEDNVRWLMTGAAQTELSGTRPTTAGSRFAKVATPRLQSLQGRYGEVVGPFPGNFVTGTVNPATIPGDPLPGRAGVDDLVSNINDQRAPPVLASGTWTLSAITFGIPPLWWTGTTAYDWSTTRSSFNSPPDLHGRMKALAAAATGPGAIVPRLVYAKPEWGNGESKDDPYEILLGPSAPANGWMSDPNTAGFMPVFDNPFSIAELEPVLRPYDSDTFRMPLRLSAMLGSLAEEARLRVTTTSWDTTAITGTAAANLGKWIQKSGTNFVAGTSPLNGTLGGEAARWERFDLNRPLTSVSSGSYSATHPYYVQRQAYFKDLYTLVCAVLHPSGTIPAGKGKEYAQWVANVVEFRDADSTMTPFEYDTDPVNGWNVDGDVAKTTGEPDRDVVWGAERPEILIMQTSAWEDNTKGELYIVLHRPWNADAISTSGTVPGEPVDVALDVPGVPRNQVDLGRKSGTASPTDATAYPVWRLRIDDGAGNQTLVRLDVAGTGTSGEFSSSSITGTASTPKMAPDSWLCVLGGTTVGMTITTTGTVNIDRSGSFRVPGPLPTSGTPPGRDSMVYLERLTDPSAVGVNATTWTTNSGTSVSGTSVPHYHVVDQAPVWVVNRFPPASGAPPPPETTVRKASNPAQAIWRSDFKPPSQSTSLGWPSFANAKAMWFPWPNRPFVSAAELALVPGADAGDIVPGKNASAVLKSYEAAMPNKNRFRDMHFDASLNHLALLDAVHVPTRFAGIHRTVTSDPTNALDQRAGIYYVTTPVNQISSYREPGRVNLNTITADDVWCAAVAGSLTGTASGGLAQPAPLKSRVSTGAGQPIAAPVASANDAADFVTTPAESMSGLLAMQGSASRDIAADTHPTLAAAGNLNPAHLLYTANRLANTATIRSNVFAVWITLRERNPDDPDSVKYHRAFYIVDRSIPVAHEPGKDHNAWDAVLLRRIIE